MLNRCVLMFFPFIFVCFMLGGLTIFFFFLLYIDGLCVTADHCSTMTFICAYMECYVVIWH